MAETEFRYDVFVSYSSANKDWVRKTFVSILENAGLKVCDYYRDFDVGAPIVMEMERAILESRKTIPILSPAYLKSGWTEFESLMFQTLDAANRERRVLPVILLTCELPLRIKYMNCINFANPDDIEIEWQRLSRALRVTLSPTSTLKVVITADWHLAHPYPMPPNFTGRAAEQKMLDDWIADDKDRLFILRALGGFGKSALELADETAQKQYSHPVDYVRAYWLLGAAYCANNELTLAEENLSKALNLCRQINMVDHEANILLDLAQLSFAYGLRSASGSAQDRLAHFEKAKSRAAEALAITEGSGYVLQGADVHLLLATLAVEGHRSKVEGGLSDKEAAIFHAKEALKLAHCDDGPPSYYKVAYEEAEHFLENLN